MEYIFCIVLRIPKPTFCLLFVYKNSAQFNNKKMFKLKTLMQFIKYIYLHEKYYDICDFDFQVCGSYSEIEFKLFLCRQTNFTYIFLVAFRTLPHFRNDKNFNFYFNFLHQCTYTHILRSEIPRTLFRLSFYILSASLVKRCFHINSF